MDNVLEKTLAESGYAKIDDWYSEVFEQGSITSIAGGALRYSLKGGKADHGSLVFVTGRTDFIEKYQECCWDLRDLDQAICLYDHFGQGESGRQLDDRQKGHIDDFQIYVSDLKKIIDTVVLPAQSGPVYLLAHSMGGTVSVLLSQRFPDLVDGLILIAPMFQINAGPFLPPLLVEAISNLACLAGGSSSYIPGGGPFDTGLAFKNNVLTTDPGRFKHSIELVRKNSSVGLGSPTFGWLKQAYRAMRMARRAARTMVCPTIIFAAADERVVRLPEIQRYCHDAGCCRLVTYKNGEHELLMERDEIRNDLLRRVRDFLQHRG